MIKKYTFIFLLLILGFHIQAQEPPPTIGYHIIEDEELYATPVDSTLELFTIKITEAWQTGDTAFLFNAIDSAISLQRLDPIYFMGVALVIYDEIPQQLAYHYLNVYEQIKRKYRQQAPVQKLIYSYDLQLAFYYYDLKKMEDITSNSIKLLEENKLVLDEEELSILFNLKLYLLDQKGNAKDKLTFVNSFYEKYPKALFFNYLNQKYTDKHYQTIVKEIKSTNEPNPMLLLITGLSYMHLNQNKQAQQYFDEILKRYNAPTNIFKKDGSIPTVFEGDLEGSSSLLPAYIESMLEFYFKIGNKAKACNTLELLIRTINYTEKNKNFLSPKNQYLIDKSRVLLEEKIQEKENIALKSMSKKMIEWSNLCSH